MSRPEEVSIDIPSTTFEDSFSKEVWETTYRSHNDTTIDDTMRRVARFVASAEETDEGKEVWEARFYDMLSNFKCTAGGRIYANAGTEWGGTTLMNCFVSPRENYDVDSLPAIIHDVLNQAQTLKSEGGWGQNFSWLRPRGAFINGIGVETPGSVKYMEIYDKVSDVITSGSGRKSANKKAKGKIRKGAMMGVLDVWHPDIEEFIRAKQQPGRLTKFNVSVNCTDEFMNKVTRVHELQNSGATPEEIEEVDKWDLRFPDTTNEQYKEVWDGNLKHWEDKGLPTLTYKTISATGLWNLIMESTYNRAEPGVLFLDRANHFGPLNYSETISATNPSMPAGTLVHTYDGIFPIEQLDGKTFSVKSLNGEWAPAKCRLSGEDEDLLEISFGANRTVSSTKKHRWPVYDTRMKRVYKAYTHELKTGDLIPLNRNEKIGIHGDETLTRDEGFFVGYVVGDGWFSNKGYGQYNVGITFGSHERAMADYVLRIVNKMKSTPSTVIEKDTGELCIQFSCRELTERMITRYKMIPGRKDIPESVWRGNDTFVEGFIDGLLSADGNIFFDDNNQKITLTTSRKELAQQYGKLMGFAGIPVSIWHRSLESKFPNGRDYEKTYERWDVAIHGRATLNFFNVFEISHPDKHQKLEEMVSWIVENKRESHQQSFAKVINVKPAGTARVWDISVEHDQHVFPTEWCYTGNCGEQTLAPGGVCNLGSVNLTQFVLPDGSGFDLEKITKYVRYLNRFLDNINSLSNAPLPEYVDSMRKKRRIGIGVLGWGSALFMMKVRFGSDTAAELRDQVMRTIAREAYMCSIDLAEEKGMFEYCQPEKHVEGAFVRGLNLSQEYMDKMKRVGIRNSSLLSIQPTGNTSILANVVSGGLEPLFMPEYIRTVIVNTMPEEIADVCPKWYEGEWCETEMFKFSKEGDEEILRGEHNGTVYKIDHNRGLTKEVLCQDYGVRWLESRGEWDPNADWAVTTSNLQVQDHVDDLKGFARWVDSAMSKTVNVPHDYPFEEFKNIYLESYMSGYVKGVTTYRAGTMTTVLSAKEEKNADTYDEEIILDDVKLPNQGPASYSVIRAEGKKWYLTTIMDEQGKRPVAFFVHTNAHEKTVTTHDAVEHLLHLAREKNIPERWVADTEEKIKSDNNATKISRCISLNLRHGVLIKNVVTALENVENAYVGTFLFQIKKYLMTWIKDGEKVSNGECPECGAHDSFVYSEGCVKCSSCGYSKCG